MTNLVHIVVVQQPPAVLDLNASVNRACHHIADAATLGAHLVVFPEAWLTGYPAWVFGMAGWNDPTAKQWYGTFVAESPTLCDARITPIFEEAARRNVTVVLGLTERARPQAGTLYNSQILITPDGEVAGVHRKLTPTHAERLVWAPGDASGLTVHPTSAGRLGGLTCWEHWHPLARHTLHTQDEQIHVAAWPDMPEMHHIASRSYAFEGRCFVACAGQYLTISDVPDELQDAYHRGIAPDSTSDIVFNGGSGIIGPDGEWRTGPLTDKPGLVHTQIDLSNILPEKHDLDVAGHYDRPDIFQLTVTPRPHQSVRFNKGETTHRNQAL